MKLQGKLLLGFLFCACLTLVTGLFANNRLHQLAEADTFLYEKATIPMEDLLKMTEGFQRIRMNLLDFVTTEVPAMRERSRKLIQELRTNIDTCSSRVEPALLTPHEQEIFTTYKTRRQEFRVATDEIIALADAGKRSEAYSYLSVRGREIATAYQQAIHDLVAAKVAQGKDLAEGNTILAITASKLLYAVMGLSVLLSIVLGILLTRNIMRQLGEMIDKKSAQSHRIIAGYLADDGDLFSLQCIENVGGSNRALERIYKANTKIVIIAFS